MMKINRVTTNTTPVMSSFDQRRSSPRARAVSPSVIPVIPSGLFSLSLATAGGATALPVLGGRPNMKNVSTLSIVEQALAIVGQCETVLPTPLQEEQHRCEGDDDDEEEEGSSPIASCSRGRSESASSTSSHDAPPASSSGNVGRGRGRGRSLQPSSNQRTGNSSDNYTSSFPTN